MYEDIIAWLEVNLWNFLYSAAALVVIYAAYRALMGFIRHQAKEHELEPHITNIIKLLMRIVFIVVATTTTFQIFKLPTDFFVGGSALIGAAIGFGSSQTINNIVAGFYVLISQPFKVKDYVRIADLEGQVEEISINYTNLYTPTFNILKVPNTQVMSSKILNMTHEGYIKYTYRVSFDHIYTEEKVFKEILEPAIQDFHQFCGDGGIRCPEAYLESADRLGKTYLIRLFIPKGEAKMLFTMQPELTQFIMKHFDKVRTGTK
jgi:small-conductance mechanosensitive channel